MDNTKRLGRGTYSVPLGFKNLTGLFPANNTEAQHLPPLSDYFCVTGKNPNTEDPALNAKVRHITY